MDAKTRHQSQMRHFGNALFDQQGGRGIDDHVFEGDRVAADAYQKTSAGRFYVYVLYRFKIQLVTVTG